MHASIENVVSAKSRQKNYCGYCSLVKFSWYLRHNFTGTFCLWLKASSNDLSTELTLNSNIPLT